MLPPREQVLRRQEREQMSAEEEDKRIREAPRLGLLSYLAKLGGNVGYALAHAPPMTHAGPPLVSTAAWTVDYPEIEKRAQAVYQAGQDAAQALSDRAMSRLPDEPWAAALAGGAFAGAEEGAEYVTSRGLAKGKGLLAPSRAALAAQAKRQAEKTLRNRLVDAAKSTLRKAPATLTEAVVVEGTREPRELGEELIGDSVGEMIGVLPDMPPEGTRQRKWLERGASALAKGTIKTVEQATQALGVRSLAEATPEHRRVLLGHTGPNKFVGLMVDAAAPLDVIEADLLGAGVSEEFTGRLMESARRRQQRLEAQRRGSGGGHGLYWHPGQRPMVQ
jgi:hypothetical protein